jgi:DNA-binding GntR family transcriptional regulator
MTASIPTAALGEQVYAQLLEAILDCSLRPGSEVFEGELAERYAVSKSPVRDALIRLRSDGLVEVSARRGYRIKPVSLADVVEMYAMRMIYERAAVTGVIQHADDAALAALDRFNTSENAGDLRRWVLENRDFHSALAQLSGNSRLHHAARKLMEESDRIMHMGLSAKPHQDPIPRFGQAHAEIIAAIQERKKRVALALIAGHIEGSRDRALRALRAQPIVM